MKREPSAFSFVKALEVGDSMSLPAEKAYAARCAVAYLAEEYERTFSVTTTPDGVTIKRTA